ncbi:hypothetical protein DVH05_024085 [Phytophthora capsici]|nr:hypothetical protein DVH05_024085 [Phytophthora capsici]
MVQEMLGNKAPAPAQVNLTDQEKPKEMQETVGTSSVEPTFSRRTEASLIGGKTRAFTHCAGGRLHCCVYGYEIYYGRLSPFL